MSIPLRAVQDGLLSIFDGWQIVDPFALYEQGGLAAIEKHFTALAARTGLPTTIPDATLFDVYWNLFNSKRVTEAEQVLARALELHHDSLGTLNFAAQRYKQNGNTVLAVETLSKLLLLYPNHRGARSMLKALQVDASAIPPEAPVSQKDLAKYIGGYGASSVVFEIERRGDKISGKTSEQQFELEALSATKFRFSEHSNVYADDGVSLKYSLFQQRSDAVVQTVVALLGIEQKFLEAGVWLGFGHHAAQVALVVHAIGVPDQHRALVFATAMADDRREVSRAVLRDRGALAFLHFRQRVEIDSHTGMILGDSLQVSLQLTANLSNGGNDRVQGVRFDLHIEDQLGEVEIARIFVQHAVALAQRQPLFARVRCFRTVGIGFGLAQPAARPASRNVKTVRRNEFWIFFIPILHDAAGEPHCPASRRAKE